MPKRGYEGGNDENVPTRQKGADGRGLGGKGNNNLALNAARAGGTKLTGKSQRKRKTYDYMEALEVVRIHFIFCRMDFSTLLREMMSLCAHL
jgi:hypothetical protein